MNGFWSVRDLGSRNGTKVNGVRCQSKWLMPGDVVSVAKHRYELLYTPTGEAPPPEDNDPFALSLMEKAGLVHQEREAPPSNGNRHVLGQESDLPADWLNEN